MQMLNTQLHSSGWGMVLRLVLATMRPHNEHGSAENKHQCNGLFSVCPFSCVSVSNVSATMAGMCSFIECRTNKAVVTDSRLVG
jgi:hypothetical protein